MSGLLDTGVTILLFILVLGGLVLAHEFGHFVTARLAKVREAQHEAEHVGLWELGVGSQASV